MNIAKATTNEKEAAKYAKENDYTYVEKDGIFYVLFETPLPYTVDLPVDSIGMWLQIATIEEIYNQA